MAHFPTIRSVLDPGALASLLEESYGVQVQRLQLLKPVILDTYRVWTPGGPYILRVYPARGRGREAIAAELDFLAFLQARDVPVSVAVGTKSGERLLGVQAPEGVRYAALFTYAPGEPPPAEAESAQRFGRLLAQLHEVGAAFPDSGVRAPLDVAFLLERPLARLAAVPEHAGTARTLREMAERMGPALAALGSRAPAFTTIHGDCWRGNAHEDAAGHITLFDFDFCGPGWRAYDIATFLDGEPAAVAAAFLAGYEAVQPLTAQEREAIPLLQAAQKIWMLGTRAAHLDAWGMMRLTDAFVGRVVAEIGDRLRASGRD